MMTVPSITVIVIIGISLTHGYSDICNNKSDGTTFEQDNSNKKFILCQNNEQIVVNCHNDYSFDRVLRTCVHDPETIKVPEMNFRSANPCEGKPNYVLVPSERGCQYFYFCHNDEAFLGTCPFGFYFDYQRMGCYREAECYIPTTTTEILETTIITDTTLPITTTATQTWTEETTTPNYSIITDTTPITTTATQTWTEDTTTSTYPIITDTTPITTTGTQTWTEETTTPNYPIVTDTTPITTTATQTWTEETTTPNYPIITDSIPITTTATQTWTEDSTTSNYVTITDTTIPITTTTTQTWPEENTTSNTATEELTSTVEPTSICAGKPNGELIKNPDSCDSFFMCHFELPVLGRCSSPLLFNPLTSNCDYPENVNCNEPNMCDDIADGVLINNHESCAHFYLCVNNVARPGKCPLGLWFDETNQKCNGPDEVDCTPYDTTTATPEITTTTAVPNTCIGIPDWTLVSNPSGCNLFYLCLDNVAIKGICPPPSLFNPNLKMCGSPDLVYCPEDHTTYETTTENINKCYGVPDFTFLNDPRTCAGHFLCYKDQSIPRNCPEGFFFNPEMEICDRSEMVDCTDWLSF